MMRTVHFITLFAFKRFSIWLRLRFEFIVIANTPKWKQSDNPKEILILMKNLLTKCSKSNIMHMNFILSTRIPCYIISASIWIQLPHQPDNYYKEEPKERKCQKRNPKKLMAPPINFNLMQCVHLLRQGRSYRLKNHTAIFYILSGACISAFQWFLYASIVCSTTF